MDAVAKITSYAEYNVFGERLRAVGFSEDRRESAPLCRWINEDTILDVMPIEENVLGFTNRWYRDVMERARNYQLPNDLEIRIITAPLFLATKIEAFKARGTRDPFTSHDLEDIIAVVDGREELVSEIQTDFSELKSYLRKEIRSLLDTRRFVDALPGYLLPDATSQSRITLVLQRLRELASLPD